MNRNRMDEIKLTQRQLELIIKRFIYKSDEIKFTEEQLELIKRIIYKSMEEYNKKVALWNHNMMMLEIYWPSSKIGPFKQEEDIDKDSSSENIEIRRLKGKEYPNV